MLTQTINPKECWNCKRCNLTLGIIDKKDAKVHIKWKKLNYIVSTPIITTCRKCNKINKLL